MSTTESAPDPAGEVRLTSNPQARDASAWVVRFGQRLQPGARVLDIACGHGRNARYLAARGCRVTAVDRDPACAASLAGIETVDFHQADLEAGPWPYDGQVFDAVIVIHYLHRPLLPKLAAALAPGGLLLHETFAVGNERFGRPRNPDYLLRPRELLDACTDLHVLAFEDGYLETPTPAMVQRLAALKIEPAQPVGVELLRL